MKKPILILILIVIIALAFRIPAILSTQSFWFDEMVSLEIAQKGIADSWQYLKWENNPPLHYWMLNLWIKAFGLSEIALRFSSILFNLLALIALYLLGKKLINARVGLLAGFLMAVSSYQLYLSVDARMYSMLSLFGILSFYYFWLALNNSKKTNWLLYILFTILTLYTHLTGCFVIICQFVYFIYYYKTQKKSFQPLMAQIIVLILFAPWLINFIITRINRFNSGAWYFHTSGSGFLPLQLPRSFLLMGDVSTFIDLVALIIFGILFIYSLARIYGWSVEKFEFKIQLKIKAEVVYVWLIFSIPIIIGFILQVWVAKYYTPAAIGFYLIAAMGFNNLKIKTNYKSVLVVLIFIILLPYNAQIIKINKHSWHKVAEYVEAVEKENDKILITAFAYQLPFEYYYQGNSEVIGYGPEGLENDLLLKTVKYNWYPVLTEENMPDLNQILAGAKRVIAVHPTTAELIHNAGWALDWLVDNNWQLLHREQFGGFIQPSVFVFERPF